MRYVHRILPNSNILKSPGSVIRMPFSHWLLEFCEVSTLYSGGSNCSTVLCCFVIQLLDAFFPCRVQVGRIYCTYNVSLPVDVYIVTFPVANLGTKQFGNMFISIIKQVLHLSKHNINIKITQYTFKYKMLTHISWEAWNDKVSE
jgi:hypothetical protein